ncbi:MAG: Nif3-like dinuclear metal center hexameric protein [Bacteroidales bacterium]|nr:Nif3-like dinuclear metal center hexameric protein [Bacteroidales bacterium]
MKIREIIGALEQFAPLSLQDEYDNAGLQIGLTEDADASGALLCLDVTEEVIAEAAERGCNLIVAHHPLLFHAPKRIVGDDYVQRCIMQAIRSGIAIYSAHTNLDNAPGGVSWRMAEKLGLTKVHPLLPLGGGRDGGAGVVGALPTVMEREDFIALVKETFDADSVRYNSWTGERVKTVALCGGAGAFLIPEAIDAGADVFITGEIGYHRFFGYENDIQLMEIGHYESEQFTLEILREIITKTDPSLPVFDTTVETNPINYL